VARRNASVGNEEIALFEIARVYNPDGDLPEERRRVGGIVQGAFARAKGAVEAVYDALHTESDYQRTTEPFLHPGKAARTTAGWVGELNPALVDGSWSAFELDLDTLFADAVEAPQYEDVITFPAVKQDLAFVVEEGVAAGDLVDAARAAVPELREMSVFDVYHGEQAGEGRKSVAFRVAFQSPERTLSDEEAAVLRERIVEVLGERFGAVLRA